MTKSFTILLLSIFLFGACTNNEKQANQASNDSVLYSHAGKGLVLKSAPDQKSAELEIISYGDQLTVLDSAVGKPLVSETYGSYRLQGKWIKVRTEDQQEGYALEPYLFPFKPSFDIEKDGSFFNWFAKNYFSGASVSSQTADLAKLPKKATEGSTINYDNGVTYQYANYEEGFSEALQVPINKLSLLEALVIFRSALFSNSKITTQYDKGQNSIVVSDEVAFLELKEAGEQLIITLVIGNLEAEEKRELLNQ